MVIMPISSHLIQSRAMTGHLMTLHNTIMKEVGKYIGNFHKTKLCSPKILTKDTMSLSKYKT